MIKHNIESLSTLSKELFAKGDATALTGGNYPIEKLQMSIAAEKGEGCREYSLRDVAASFLPTGIWESEHFGYCSIPCRHEHSCPAVFYFNGTLRVYCVNMYCTAKERKYVVPECVISMIKDRWNESRRAGDDAAGKPTLPPPYMK